MRDHMQRAKVEEEFWRTASIAEMDARLGAIQAQSRRRAAEAAWREAQRQCQEAQARMTAAMVAYRAGMQEDGLPVPAPVA